jgi:outer membrane protein assembly factor BamB
MRLKPRVYMMRKVLLWTTVAVIVAGGAVSCLATQPVEPTPVEFTTVDKGDQSAVNQSSSKVIKDQETWEATWASLVANLIEHRVPPEIDWGRYILLAHFMGQRPTSGYAVEFTEVLEGDEISATVKEVSPAPECILAQVITAPYDIIQIPKTDKQVKFTVQQEIQPCPIPTWVGWPMFHGDPQRTGKAEAAGIITNSTTLRWSCPGAGITSSPVVDEYGTVYFGSSDGKLYALNASDGALKFSTPLAGPGVRIDSSPGLSGSGSKYPGRIYIGTADNETRDNFFALNTSNLGVIWSRQVPDGNSSAIYGLSSPLVVTDPLNREPVIYLGAQDGFLYCIRDKGDHGDVVWNTTLQPVDTFWAFRSSAAMSPVAPPNQLGTIYCGGQDGGAKLFALDPYTGAINDTKSIVLNATPVNWASSPSVTIVDGNETIFAGTCDPERMTGQMCAVKIVGPNAVLAANYQTTNATLACPAIYDLNADGRVEAIFGDMGGTVYALTYDPYTGWSTYWTVTGCVEICSSAAVALAPQPTVFVGASSYPPLGPPGGTIYSISWNGTLLGNYITPVPELFVTTSPAIAQQITGVLGAPGWVFVGSWDIGFGNGKLYAFGPPP